LLFLDLTILGDAPTLSREAEEFWLRRGKGGIATSANTKGWPRFHASGGDAEAMQALRDAILDDPKNAILPRPCFVKMS
jgi:hypothetical protein